VLVDERVDPPCSEPLGEPLAVGVNVPPREAVPDRVGTPTLVVDLRETVGDGDTNVDGVIDGLPDEVRVARLDGLSV
jgi:hypothetical protein